MLLEGNVRDHMITINDFCYEKFNATRSLFGVVHEMDIRKWAKQKSIEVNFEIFIFFSSIILYLTNIFVFHRLDTINSKHQNRGYLDGKREIVLLVGKLQKFCLKKKQHKNLEVRYCKQLKISEMSLKIRFKVTIQNICSILIKAVSMKSYFRNEH